MSNERLKTLRTHAFQAQQGRCFYCGFVMWLSSPDELILRSRASRAYQCTAEHLLARQDGGKDVASNVVAACHLCNLRRHRRPNPAPSAEVYRAHVRQRVAKGKWHPPDLRVAMVAASQELFIGKPAFRHQ
ncbi:HNH endonuclease [uncultured Stenotrophomonas sp.]|uniref:HNH endonuclease n=1 Tax=uncultured Stenotrophomonas sp. TaxID=165438 RepID=UPI0028D17B75|nr:HNH endonuclease [uncultured Stenotrophomonas sp.]